MKQRKSLRLVVVILLILTTTLTYNQFFKNDIDDEDKIDELKYDLKIDDYIVYDLDELNFRFVIANISNKKIIDEDILIENLKINNKVINEYDRFLEKLASKDYKGINFDKLDLSMDLTKDNFEILLIITDYNLETLNVKYSNKELFNIDLKENITNKLEVNIVDDPNESDIPKDKVINEDSFKLEVGTTFRDQNFIYLIEGEEFQSSSKETLHFIPITLISNDGSSYKISAAKFDFDDYPGDMDAKENFMIRDFENILYEETTNLLKGGLIFITYGDPEGNIKYSGTLKLLINNNKWIEIKVVL